MLNENQKSLITLKLTDLISKKCKTLKAISENSTASDANYNHADRISGEVKGICASLDIINDRELWEDTTYQVLNAIMTGCSCYHFFLSEDGAYDKVKLESAIGQYILSNDLWELESDYYEPTFDIADLEKRN